MVPQEIRGKRDKLAGTDCQVNWCNDQRLNDENMEGVGPGGDLNPFGWYVIGTTGGGNAIVVRADDPAVYFADHEWDAPATPEGVRKALVLLVPSIEEFLTNVDAMARLIDRIG